MLTIIETCRQQKRNAFDYIRAAVAAHTLGELAPKILTRV
jgi:hypothetical protein